MAKVSLEREYPWPSNAAHAVPSMLCLEYRMPRARAWAQAFRMHEAGIERMAQEAEAMAAQDGWSEWRIVREWQPGKRPTFATELTPAGEQTVIPGCERNASPKAVQLGLFG